MHLEWRDQGKRNLGQGIDQELGGYSRTIYALARIETLQLRQCGSLDSLHSLGDAALELATQAEESGLYADQFAHNNSKYAKQAVQKLTRQKIYYCKEYGKKTVGAILNG